MWASKSAKWLDLLHLFLDHGADPNRRLAYKGFNNATPLHVVINSYQLSDRAWTDEELAAIIKKFLDCGANPNLEDHDKNSALRLAIIEEPEIALILENYKPRSQDRKRTYSEIGELKPSSKDTDLGLVKRGKKSATS